LVHGTVTTDAWTDKDTGEKRRRAAVLAEVVGPSLRWATARITKTTRTHITDEAPYDAAEQEGPTRPRDGRPSSSHSRRRPCQR
jgi:hypothetical protein